VDFRGFTAHQVGACACCKNNPIIHGCTIILCAQSLFKQDQCILKFGDLEAEIEKLKTQKSQQDEELQHLKSQISNPKFSVSAPKWDDTPLSRLLSSPPTSCQELKNNNGLWPMDGIHLLKKIVQSRPPFAFLQPMVHLVTLFLQYY